MRSNRLQKKFHTKNGPFCRKTGDVARLGEGTQKPFAAAKDAAAWFA